MEPISLGDARKLPFRDRFFGLVLTSPPWDDPQALLDAKDEIRRTLKKRGYWAMILPNLDHPDKASLVVCNRDWSKQTSYVIDKPSEMIGPSYFSPSEELIHKVLDQFPWVRTVLDPFCGSGRIVKVARERGLDAYGVDIDPATIEIAKGLAV